MMLVARPVAVALLVGLLAASSVCDQARADGSGASIAELPDDHEVKLAESARTEVAEPDSLSLTIAARSGFVISREAPVVVELRPEPAQASEQGGDNGVENRPSPGLEIPRRRYRRSDAADPRAESPRFDLRYKALRTGSHRLSIDIRFWVCHRSSCRPVAVRRDVRIDAE